MMPFDPLLHDDLPLDRTRSGWTVVARAADLGCVSIRPRIEASGRGGDAMSALLRGWFFDPRGFSTGVRNEKLGLVDIDR